MTEDRQVPGVLGLLSWPDRPAPGGRDAASAFSSFRTGLPGTMPESHSSIEVICWRTSARQATRRSVSVIFAPPRVRCQTPNRTCTTTSGGRPCRLTCPSSVTAGSACCHCRGVKTRVGRGGDPPPLVVGVAIAASAVGGAGARRDRAREERRQRPDPGIGEELPDRRLARPLAELPDVRLAQDRLRHRGLTLASGHRALHHAGRQRRQLRRPGDLVRGQPLPGQPGEAAVTHPAEPRVPVVAHPPARHTARPSSRCPAGRDSTRLTGSQPASERKDGSSRAASRCAWPSSSAPASTWPYPAAPAAAAAPARPPRRSWPDVSRLLAGAGHRINGGPQPARVRVQIHL